MYVGMYVCMYVCMYVRTYVRTYVQTYVCMYGWMDGSYSEISSGKLFWKALEKYLQRKVGSSNSIKVGSSNSINNILEKYLWRNSHFRINKISEIHL